LRVSRRTISLGVWLWLGALLFFAEVVRAAADAAARAVFVLPRRLVAVAFVSLDPAGTRVAGVRRPAVCADWQSVADDAAPVGHPEDERLVALMHVWFRGAIGSSSGKYVRFKHADCGTG
jgi:hypothetical protein